MKILAIETSCDETAAAIVDEQGYQPKVLTNVVTSQLEIHASTGGVIPNVAARLHNENLPRVLQEATDKKRLGYDAVAVTAGPGLIGCLLQGLSAAKSIALAQNLPFFAINHLEGHIYSAWLSKIPPELPALVIIASGGHTELILMERHLTYQLLGTTRDDAAGEAFDKVARLLDLSYPGGPAIANLATHGDPHAYHLPIGLEERDNLEFSFSGLKAAVYHLIEKLPKPLAAHTKADIAASFQHTIATTISRKTGFALQQNPLVKTVCLVGGVSANIYLRSYLEKTVHQIRPHCRFVVPPFEYCTDNAAMIGAAAVFRNLFGKPGSWYDVVADPNLPL